MGEGDRREEFGYSEMALVGNEHSPRITLDHTLAFGKGKDNYYCRESLLVRQSWAKKLTCFDKQQPGRARQKILAT